MPTHLLLSDARSVRDEHGRMFRSLNRQLGIHKQMLSEEGWRLLTRAAFSLYLDSLERQLPLLVEDQFANDLTEPDLDATEALTASPVPNVHQRAAWVADDLKR